MNIDAFIATTRFGLGPRQGEMREVAGDPRGWLVSQLRNPHMPQEITALRTQAGEAVQLYAELFQSKKKQQMAGENRKKEIRKFFVRQSGLRFAAQVASRQSFIERLVLFWSNHFTVSIQKAVLTPFVNLYEAEAIRPHVCGRFADLLQAVEHHPAMLIYLDNARSIGPNSKAGQRRGKGLNENLAREILELHTLGVNGGYTQKDVLALAKIITGWGVDPKQSDKATFSFHELQHEPGSKTLLGKTYRENGEREGVEALNDLARHPATARHIATKLARHFISDEPPQSAIDQLARTFTNTDGDLKAVYETLIGLQEAWSNLLAKFKTTYEYAVSAFRLIGVTPGAEMAVKSLASANFVPFSAPSPAGLPDTASAWVSSDAVMKKIEWAQVLSRNVTIDTSPLQLADAAFGPVMREETKFVISGAASGQDGLAFVLSSPEFQRR